MYATLGNRVVEIADAQIESYKVKGYTITDESGNIISEAPKSVNELQRALDDERAINEKLLKEIADLKAQLDKAKAATISVSTEGEESAPKKSTRKTKSAE